MIQNTNTHTHVCTNTLPFFLELSQGPISGPRLSAQACVRGPIGSPQGCKRPQGSRRIITLFISPSLMHPCIHTTTICSQRELLSFFPLCFSCYSGLQSSRTKDNPERYSMQILGANLLRWRRPEWTRSHKHMHNLHIQTNESMEFTHNL